MKALPVSPPVLLCLLGLAAPLVAGAQTEVEEIVVTAQKIEESVQKIPISIKVLSAQTLETTNADSLSDIARLVPSMSMAELGRGRSNVQIRGLGSNVGSVGTSAIYNDGVIAASRVSSSGTFTEQDSVLFDVERVEVLRGPQGTLYGEGSFGGVVNIISKRPNPREFEAGFSGSWYDIKNGGSGGNDLNGMINVPLVADKFAVRLVGFRNDHDGWLDGYDILPVLLGAPAPTLVGKDLNTEKVSGGRISFGYTGDNVDAVLILKRQKTTAGLAALESDFFDILQTTLPGGTNNRAAFIGPDPLITDVAGTSTVDEGILEINGKTAYGTWTSVTGYGQIDGESLSGVTGDTEAWSEELRFSTDRKGPINWTAGAFYRTVDKTALLNGSGLRDDAVDQWSVFGQMYWDMRPDLRATFGLRYGKQKTVVDDRLNEATLGPLAHASATFSDLSPKIALDWRMNEDTLLYASIAEGYRAGGANIDVSLGEDPRYSRDFKADSIINYEVGAKATFLDKKVTINTAVFYIDWSDIQIDRPIDDNRDPGNPTIAFIVLNGQDAHSYGIESDIYLNPAPGWEIVLGGSLVNAQYDNGFINAAYLGGPIFDLKGVHLPSSPEYLYNASVSKTFPLGSSKLHGLVRADYSVRGNSYADVPNTAEGTDFGSGELRVLNVRAGVIADKWEVQGFVTNLTDFNGSTFDFDEQAPDNFLFRGRLQPRTIGVNVKVRF